MVIFYVKQVLRIKNIPTWKRLAESRLLLETAGTSLLYGPFPV